MKRNDIIFLLSSTVILTIAWIIFSVVHASTTSSISGDENRQIQSIAPGFDTTTIHTLGTRPIITPVYSLQSASLSASVNIAATPTPSAGPLVSPTFQPTPGITLTLTPTVIASQGGITQ